MDSTAIILTGTWGTGKSAILTRLAQLFPVIPEPARLALAADPSLHGDWLRFIHELLDRSIADHVRAGPGMTLFDRGVPDCLAYARWFGLERSTFQAAEQRHRYHGEVLICLPWRDIYVNDDLRLATFEMAMRFNDVLVDTYRDLGYELVEVPQTSVAERTRFVREFVDGRRDP